MIKEIIRDNFKKAKEHVYNLLMPTFFGIDESHPPRPLCDVSFANRQTQNIDFNSILNQCIIDTLEEASSLEYVVNDFTPLIFEPEKDYKDIKSIADLKAQKSLNLEYIKSYFYIKSMMLFNEEVVFVIKPFFNDPYYFKNFESESMMLNFKMAMNEILQGRKVQFVSLFEKYDQDLQIIPKLCGLENLYLKDYINKVIHGKNVKYFLDQIKEYNEFVKTLQTEEGYELLLKDRWKYILHDLKMWLKMNCKLSTSKVGFSAFLDRFDINDPYNFEWFVTFITSETIYSTIGYIPGVDNTFIVSGYLKSIEQLLTNIIIEDGKLFHYKTYVEYDDEDGDHCYIDIKESRRDKITIGNILEYVKRKTDFIPDEIERDNVIESIKVIHKKRNDYLHKKILVDYQIIELVRNQTFIAMFSVLNALYKKHPAYRSKETYKELKNQ